MIKFCSKCKGILILKKGKAICYSCGFVQDSEEILSSSEKIPKKEERGEGTIKGGNIFATYEHKCEKCGYDKAQIIDCGVFYSDEDSIIFLKCGKCGFSEKIGDES